MGFQYDSRSEVVWISKRQLLPNTCCSCGLYSDNTVSVKRVEHVREFGNHNSGGAMFLLTLIMHVFLGPLGWILSVLLEGDTTKKTTKTVKKKSKIKITQCPLCHASEPAEILETRDGQCSFLVHPVFKERLEEANLESD